MLHDMRVLAVGDPFFIISKINKTSCFKSRHFINIYIINRTLHGRLGIRILSSRAESISQHSKIKFVSPRGHVISSINEDSDLIHMANGTDAGRIVLDKCKLSLPKLIPKDSVYSNYVSSFMKVEIFERIV